MTTQTALYNYLSYRDAPAALDWLGSVFGFETTARYPGEDGGVAHAELRRGDAAIIVFSDRAGYARPPRRGDTGGFGVYLAVDEPAEVDAVHRRAAAAGATTIWHPERNEWELPLPGGRPRGLRVDLRHVPPRGHRPARILTPRRRYPTMTAT